MSNERVTYAELSVAKDSNRHQVKPKGTKISIPLAEKELTYAQLSLQNTSQAHQGNGKKNHCKVPETQNVNASSQETGDQAAKHCGPCPKEWLTYSNSCYYVNHERKTWKDSETDCASKKSQLIHIDDQEEMTFLRIFYIFPWVGGCYNTSEGRWVWTNGSNLSSKLLTTPPSSGKNCAYFNFQDKEISSESCSETRKYICKHRLHELT
ncbi:PREDICTED: NKG2-A/NKG2-B type II integral membrane protein-like [Condylura cristata]|uniref:NKG2-A/NKG2-B type II integral membrane protein-like n=1 Tax=Condylura cristata TaxID=143302 RepID=UPI00033431D9|nr:PREDICTED: NKG2-A/NKG2-B type II integral membrane protein-like [Condylura cristata]